MSVSAIFVTRMLSHFLKNNSRLPPSQLLYCRVQEHVMICSHCLTICKLLSTGAWRKKFVPLEFSAAFDRVCHCSLLYKVRSISVGRQFLSMVSEFFTDRRQGERLKGNVSASVDVVSGVPQGCVLGPLLFILYTSELSHIVWIHIVCYADDTTSYPVIPRPLSRPQMMELLNRHLAAIYYWCLKKNRRLNPEKTKSTVVGRSRTVAPGYDDLTVGGAVLEEVKSLRILGVTLDSMLTLETHLPEVVSQVARSLGVWRRTGS